MDDAECSRGPLGSQILQMTTLQMDKVIVSGVFEGGSKKEREIAQIPASPGPYNRSSSRVMRRVQFMKRDMNVIRKILVEIESWPNRLSTGLKPLHLEGIDDAVTAEHVHQLVEAGYVQAIQVTPAEGPYEMFAPRRLTSAGHDYLDLVRDERPWTEERPEPPLEPRSVPPTDSLAVPVQRGLETPVLRRHRSIEISRALSDADVSQW